MNKAQQIIEKVNAMSVTEAGIDKEAAKTACINAAKKIHGKPNMKIIDSMLDKACKKGKDTDDVVQIVTNMMRS